jgi:hypothetical protein
VSVRIFPPRPREKGSLEEVPYVERDGNEDICSAKHEGPGVMIIAGTFEASR